MAFKSVTSHTNCLESSERCRSDQLSCVPEQVRTRIASLLSRKDFHFIEEEKKQTLPYGCYLTLLPKVPHDSDRYPCKHFCHVNEKTTQEDTDTKREMCQLYCWEERVRCTTTPATTDANTGTTGSSMIPEAPLPPGEIENSMPHDSSWRAWEKNVPQAVPWSALVIGLTTLIGYFGFLIYLCISDWQRRTTVTIKSSVPSDRGVARH